MRWAAGTPAHRLNESRHAPMGTDRTSLLVERNMDLLILVIVLLLLFGGGGGLYWGMGAGWGIGPIGLIVVALVVAYLVYGYRGRRSSRL
jgi:hypothetical protein